MEIIYASSAYLSPVLMHLRNAASDNVLVYNHCAHVRNECESLISDALGLFSSCIVFFYESTLCWKRIYELGHNLSGFINWLELNEIDVQSGNGNEK